MKFENNWYHKTLQDLEQVNDGEPSLGETKLICRILYLRRTPLIKFTIEDMRLMVGQQEALPWLVPMSIDVLKKNLFAEGDLYPGDLLQNILSVNENFWKANKGYWETIAAMLNNERQRVDEYRIQTAIFEAIF